MGGGTETYTYPAQTPAHQSQIGMQYSRFLDRVGRGFPASPFNLGYVSPTQRAAWSQAQQFGAEGMEPFTQTLTDMTRDGGMQEADATLKALGEAMFGDLSRGVRQQAGLSGMASGSSIERALAEGGKDIGLGLAKERMGLFENAQNRRMQAATGGMSLIPQALGTLGQVGEMETQPLTRQYNDWIMRNITGPLQAYTGSGSVMNMSSQQPAYGVGQQPDYLTPIASLIGTMLMYGGACRIARAVFGSRAAKAQRIGIYNALYAPRWLVRAYLKAAPYLAPQARKSRLVRALLRPVMEAYHYVARRAVHG